MSDQPPTREDCFAEAEKALRGAVGGHGDVLQGLAMIADAWTKLGAWMDPAKKKPDKHMGFGSEDAS